jgi:hypothetical protein
VIHLADTGGLNEFSVEIAWERVHALVERSIWQIKAWQRLSSLDTIMIAAMGDWIAGDIHEELRETCLPPQEATRIVREMHEYALSQLHKLKGIERIHYVGIPDNHGRTTNKYQWTNGAQQSHNWGMYHALESWCRGSGLEKMTFDIAEGSINYTEVMGHTFRIMHGHQMKGNPGTAGTRGVKWVRTVDDATPADYTLIGHFHTARDHGPLIMNGSLCGPDAYSVQNGFGSERPVQLALLVRPEFGICDVSKIFPVPKEAK